MTKLVGRVNRAEKFLVFFYESKKGTKLLSVVNMDRGRALVKEC